MGGASSELYFAYGSNLSARRMKTRVPHVSWRKRAVLSGYALNFDKVAGNGVGGYATIEQQAGQEVEGALYCISKEGLEALDRFEGVPDHYQRQEVTVTLSGSDRGVPREQVLVAWVYIARPDRLQKGLRPTQEYLNHLLAGKDLLSPAYLAQLRKITCCTGASPQVDANSATGVAGGAAVDADGDCHALNRVADFDRESLPKPRLIKPPWTEGEVFYAEDDADRMSLPVAVPPFLTAKDPATQHKHIKVDAVLLPWVTERYEAYVMHNIFTAEECHELIQMTNSKGYTPALLNMGRGRQSYRPRTRLGWRVMFDCPALASFLLEVIRPFVPQSFGSDRDGTGEELVLTEANERCRFLYYEAGQKFNPHRDGCFIRPPGHPKAGDKSRITVQLYLNDVPDAHGGATTFLDHRRSRDDRGPGAFPCQPRAGSALIFSQNLFHEGSILTQGAKYTMRTELMFGKDG